MHCGKSLENYYLCINEQVAGFMRRAGHKGDIVYLAVKVGKISYCGARGVLDEITDYKPWEDRDLYIQCFKIKDVEFCEPFDLRLLSQAGGKHWSLKYVQNAKTIKDEEAISLLNKEFESKKTESLIALDIPQKDLLDATELSNEEGEQHDEEEQVDEEDLAEVLMEVPEAKINIMGTFQTIKFYNEIDKIRGLETLVNENFYSLFPHFPEERTLLISENRMFITSGISDGDNEIITGIRGIPDGLLIVYDKSNKVPFQINLIEYECYGERRTKSLEKFNYLNGHIIPQLMRFASTFSIVTDKQIREETIKSWVEKIISYIYSNPFFTQKITSWIKELLPDIHEQQVALKIQDFLLNAFRTNLRILLIIDELTDEQKDTMKNIINSFKLENRKGIEFVGYIVRLEQKINIVDSGAEYALSVQ